MFSICNFCYYKLKLKIEKGKVMKKLFAVITLLLCGAFIEARPHHNKRRKRPHNWRLTHRNKRPKRRHRHDKHHDHEKVAHHYMRTQKRASNFLDKAAHSIAHGTSQAVKSLNKAGIAMEKGVHDVTSFFHKDKKHKRRHKKRMKKLHHAYKRLHKKRAHATHHTSKFIQDIKKELDTISHIF